MTAPPETLSERDEIEMLLPWYVTGRLDAADRLRVETALAADPALRRQLTLIDEESRETRALNETIAVPRTLMPEAVLGRIAAERRRSPAGLTSGLLAQVQNFFARPTAGAVRFAAAAAVVIMLAQALAIGGLVLSRETPGYVTASGGTAPSITGTTVIVRFADAATAPSIARGLGALGARIVDGPKPGGLFVVRIGEVSMPAADRDRIGSRMKADQALFSFVAAQ